jgi:hypothetical protein
MIICCAKRSIKHHTNFLSGGIEGNNSVQGEVENKVIREYDYQLKNIEQIKFISDKLGSLGNFAVVTLYEN